MGGGKGSASGTLTAHFGTKCDDMGQVGHGSDKDGLHTERSLLRPPPTACPPAHLYLAKNPSKPGWGPHGMQS